MGNLRKTRFNAFRCNTRKEEAKCQERCLFSQSLVWCCTRAAHTLLCTAKRRIESSMQQITPTVEAALLTHSSNLASVALGKPVHEDLFRAFFSMCYVQCKMWPDWRLRIFAKNLTWRRHINNNNNKMRILIGFLLCLQGKGKNLKCTPGMVKNGVKLPFSDHFLNICGLQICSNRWVTTFLPY